VEAISTEQADGYDDEQEPKGVDGDLDPKYESDITCMSLFVADNSQGQSWAPSQSPSISPSDGPSVRPSGVPCLSTSSRP
jgi:hypothetical protein